MTIPYLIASNISLDAELLKKSRYALEFSKLNMQNSKFYCVDSMEYLDLYFYENLATCASLIYFNNHEDACHPINMLYTKA